MEEIIEILNTQNIFKKKFDFTSLQIVKKGNTLQLDHKWRLGGLIFILIVFFLFWLTLLFFFDPRLWGKGTYILNYILPKIDEYTVKILIDKYLLYFVLIFNVLFGFNIATSLDDSKKYVEKIKKSKSDFHNNGFKTNF